MTVIPALISNILISASILGLLAAGFALIHSVTRMMHLAQGAMAIVAGYVFYALYAQHGWSVWLAVIFALVFTTALGLVLWGLIYERLRNRSAISSAGALMATFSLMLILQNALLVVFGSSTRSLRDLQGSIHLIFDVPWTTHEIVTVVLSIFLVLLLALVLRFTRLGKALRAVADQEMVAEVVGIPTKQMRGIAFGIASLCAAVAGILFAIEYGLDPSMSTSVTVRMFFRAIMGGIGSVPGALLGSLLNETGVVLTSWFWNGTWADVTSFVLTVVVLLFRPAGLLGRSRRRV